MNHFLPIFVFACLLATPACATDFNQQLKTLEGKPFLDKDGKTDENSTLGKISITALTAAFPDEANLAGAEKFKRWQIASKIQSDPNVTLSAEEVTLLKDLIGKGFPAVVVGPAWQALDPGAVSKSTTPPKK
jgi:hypothetical protein